jgi:Mu transposase-like protein
MTNTRLVVNKLIQWLADSERPVVERVLHIAQSGADVATIDVESRTAAPVWRKHSDLISAIEANEAIVLEVDHCAPPPLNESDLSNQQYDKRKAGRDKAWEIIAPLFSGENATRMLSPQTRATLIAKRALVTGVTRQTIYCYARRWWQGGQTKNALLPHYGNCGSARDGARCASYRKLGHPSRISKHEMRPTGVNVDEKWRKVIITGAKMFYENREGQSFSEAYRMTLEHFCKKGFKVEDGVKKPILPDVNEVFSLRQFKYHYLSHRAQDSRPALIKRFGERRFNLRHRELIGSSTSQASGPGALYQIDATLADVYLVSRQDRSRIIGRPVIYAVIDVFSRMIAGLCVRLEGEGYLGLMLALENTAADKVAFCAQYGITITEEMWPCRYLPEELTGDRGPLEGRNADNLANGLNIHVSNTPPYRADWKGIIEQLFRLFNIRIIHSLPGAVDRDRERGDADYRLAAVLDIHEFTAIMINAALYHNNEHRMDWYEMDREMMADQVEPYPVDLYFWGIANRSGHLRERDAETIRVQLLPEGEATVTERGIRFRQLYYTCEAAEKEGWFLKARNEGRWKIRAAFDPRSTDAIHLRSGDGRPSTACHLKLDSAFKGCDWSETADYFEQSKLANARAMTRGLQAKSDFNAKANEIVTTATDRTEQSHQPGESKQSRLSGIRANRQAEIALQYEAEKERLMINKDPDSSRRESLSIEETGSEKSDEEYVPFPQPANIRDLRENMMRHGKK